MSYIQGDIYYNKSCKVGSETECRGLKSPAITQGTRDYPVISITALADKYITKLYDYYPITIQLDTSYNNPDQFVQSLISGI